MLGVNLQIFSGTTPQANLSNIQALWWDVTEPKDAAKPVGKSDIVTTDSNGYINLDISKVSGLTVGDYGFLTLYQLNTTDAEDSLVFSGKVQTSDIVSGIDMYYYDSGWERPIEWLNMDEPTNGVQKIQGLAVIYDIEMVGNVVEVTVSGAHNIDWGDGTNDLNVAANTTTSHAYNYDDTNFDETNIVGKTDSKDVTFTANTDIVNLTAHGYQDGQLINFASIITTTGISTYTRYYVINSTANTFQVSTTIGGPAVTLTNDGTGTVFIPLYKIAVVTITPCTGENLTSFSCNTKYKHWLELRLNSEYLTNITIRYLPLIQQCWIGEHNLTSMYKFFQSCHSLQSVPLFNTQNITSWRKAFINCYSLQSVPLFNTQNATDMNQLFNQCFSLQSVPLFDTQNVTDMSYMFTSCFLLHFIPFFDTQNVTNMSSMFNSCITLFSIPFLNTQKVTNMSSIFASCYNLQKGTLNGTAVDIDYSACNLGPEALNEIYRNLAAGVTATINVTGNWGTDSDDPSLAPSGWTVTG